MLLPLKKIYDSKVLDEPVKELAFQLHLLQKKHSLTTNNLVAMTNYMFCKLSKYDALQKGKRKNEKLR